MHRIMNDIVILPGRFDSYHLDDRTQSVLCTANAPTMPFKLNQDSFLVLYLSLSTSVDEFMFKTLFLTRQPDYILGLSEQFSEPDIQLAESEPVVERIKFLLSVPHHHMSGTRVLPCVMFCDQNKATTQFVTDQQDASRRTVSIKAAMPLCPMVHIVSSPFYYWPSQITLVINTVIAQLNSAIWIVR